MPTYFPTLEAIECQSRQLHDICCRHCGKTRNLLSHGFIRKKQRGGEPCPVGKRVFCSNRRSHDGCGRTIRLYLDSTLRNLHATAGQMSAFLLALVDGQAIPHAYLTATNGPPRNAWRWIKKMQGRLTTWRSLAHQPPLPAASAPPRYRHQAVLRATLAALCASHAEPFVCSAYQRCQQQPFM